MREDFAYAVLRAVPRVERGERINVGIVLFCRRAGFLGLRTHIDEPRLRAIGGDPDELRPHLEALEAVAAGRQDGGRLAQLSPSDRFGWLVAPSSTVIQPSEVHTGFCTDPEATLERLMQTLVV